jgi:hypothetical protein
MKISPYTIYLELQPTALLVRQNFIIRKKWVLQGASWISCAHGLLASRKCRVNFLEKDEGRKSCSCVTGFLQVSLSPLVFVSAGFVSGRHRCTGAVDGFISRAGGGEYCGASIYLGDAEGLVRKVALLDGELAEALRT